MNLASQCELWHVPPPLWPAIGITGLEVGPQSRATVMTAYR